MRSIPVALFTLLTACAVEEPQVATAELAGKINPEDGCGTPVCGNTSKLFGPFYELDMTKTKYSNLGRYRIVSFENGGLARKLTIDKFDVTGTALVGGDIDKNAQLAGAKFVVEQYMGDDVPPRLAEMKIESVDSIAYMEGGNIGEGGAPAPMLPTFLLKFRNISDPTHTYPFDYVCPSSGFGAPGEPQWRHALLFTGNRWDIDGNVFASGADALPWFNIACKDTAQWKAALFRMVSAAKSNKFNTVPRDYEAATRAVVADYCGDGMSHTLPGTDVDWENRGGWLTRDVGNEDYELEALWDENGAICLTIPRRPEVDRNNIELQCNRPLPECSDEQRLNWKRDGLVMATWVPLPPPIFIAP